MANTWEVYILLMTHEAAKACKRAVMRSRAQNAACRMSHVGHQSRREMQKGQTRARLAVPPSSHAQPSPHPPQQSWSACLFSPSAPWYLNPCRRGRSAPDPCCVLLGHPGWWAAHCFVLPSHTRDVMQTDVIWSQVHLGCRCRCRCHHFLYLMHTAQTTASAASAYRPVCWLRCQAGSW